MLILEVLARNVAARGERTFVWHEGRRITYAEFDRRTNRAARALAALGVERGDRVTLALGNSLEWPIAAFGTLKAAAVLHPLNPALGAAELRYILRHAEPRVIVTSAENADALADAAPPGARIVVVAGAANGVPSLDDLIARQSEAPLESRPTEDDPSTLLYTSGTTGSPKGVLMSQRTSGASGEHFIEALRIDENDTLLAVTPLFHGNAWGALVTALRAGGTIAFPTTFHASGFWPLVHASGATVLYTLGTILAMLLTREPSDLERRNPLRVILGLGSATVRDRVIERFGVDDVAECFGSTDAGVVTITPLRAKPRPGSCGPAVAGVAVRITDDDGRELSPRQTGEITVRSPYRMAAYFRDPEETRRALRGDWFLTGDLGYVDEDGWLYFVDRKKDVIRRGGENVSSVAIEKTLREHPGVVEVAVVGVPDPVLGQEIKAFIVAKPDVDENELREFAAARLARFQVPRLWEFRDSLPKTPTQRVEKYKLRREASLLDKPLLG
jgi:acyl-CoA synthetase (AMP-forming)/AMP-acid ligase II